MPKGSLLVFVLFLFLFFFFCFLFLFLFLVSLLSDQLAQADSGRFVAIRFPVDVS